MWSTGSEKHNCCFNPEMVQKRETPHLYYLHLRSKYPPVQILTKKSKSKSKKAF